MVTGWRIASTAIVLAMAGGPQMADAQSASHLNLYGAPGLIEMPTAQTQPDGQVSFGGSYFNGTLRRNFTFQVLPRVSASLRYSTIENWGRTGNPGYDLFDRSFDLQVQLLNEDKNGWRPGLAIGGRDILGTGVYSSEYVVASKSFMRDFTATAGLGWGRLAGIGGVRNPFCTLSDRFCDRDEDYDLGGKPSFGRFFRGEDVAFFGGVAWRSPIAGLTLKAEYSSDAYTREQRGAEAVFERKSALNFGADYRLRDGVHLGAYYLYGSEIGVNLTVSGNPKQAFAPQNLGRGPVPLTPRPDVANGWSQSEAARSALAEGLLAALSQDGIALDEARFGADSVDVVIRNRRINQSPKAIGRTARVLAAGLPGSVETFRITIREQGLPVVTTIVARRDLEALVDRPDAGTRSFERVRFQDAAASLDGDVWRARRYPDFDWAISPSLSVHVFGNRNGFRPQLGIEAKGRLRLSPGLSVSGTLNQPLLGWFDPPEPAPTTTYALPNVRRDSAQYYAGESLRLMRLTGDYVFKLTPATYGRVSAGYLERQFAGIGGEILWKPANQSWGIGADLNYVRQRDPDNFAGLTDYDVVTGHASLYWDTGYRGIETQFDVGRYLAGDWGATLTVSRRFANGWSVGAYVTKTDVSAEDFGEGSFDKGIKISIPLRWATPFETRQTSDLDLRSLSSDGGARLELPNRLYPIVRDLDRAHLAKNWGAFWQ